jgi:protein ImuA
MGVKALDDALPWGGLPRAGLHEVIAADNGVAAGGFCAALLARLIESGDSERGMEENRPPNQGRANQGTALWCRRDRGLYGPGLALLGIHSARLIIVQGRTDTDLFWTMEEALRSGALVGVLGEIGAAHPTALRRLQLAAESHGTMALLLRAQGTEERSAPTLTRWRVGAAPGVPPSPGIPPSPEAGADAGGPGAPRDVRCCWRVELLRCKSGPAGFGALRHEAAGAAAPRTANWSATWPRRWLVECDETGRLAVVAELRHRPADPAARARAEA